MQTRIIVLAGGRGTRMNADIPKALVPFRNKPIITHLLESIRETGIDPSPVIVVGYGADIVKKALGDSYTYALQEEQLGTGHAVSCAQTILKGHADAVIVLYCDHPLLTAAAISRLKQFHEERGCVVTMMTTTVSDFGEWRAPFYDFGRVVRNEKGDIVDIVEKRDATPAQLEIKEVSPSFFCFRAEWLWEHISKLDNVNAKHEYYLTDLVRIAIDGGECIASVDISPLESIGVNTPEHLELAQKV